MKPLNLQYIPLVRRIKMVGVCIVLLETGGCASVTPPIPHTDLRTITSESGYVVNVPPGGTVEIVLPALCLNYSKGIPKTSDQFSSLPHKAPVEVQRLLDLYERMITQQDFYKSYLQQIAALKILVKEEHQIITPSGANVKITIQFKEHLHSSLQDAIWRGDPAYVNSVEKLKMTQSQQMQDTRQTLDDLKGGGNGTGLPPEQQQVILLLKQNGAWDTVKMELFKNIELALATQELTSQISEATRALGGIMRQTVKADTQ